MSKRTKQHMERCWSQAVHVFDSLDNLQCPTVEAHRMATLSSLASMVPEPSVSKRSKASLQATVDLMEFRLDSNTLCSRTGAAQLHSCTNARNKLSSVLLKCWQAASTSCHAGAQLTLAVRAKQANLHRRELLARGSAATDLSRHMRASPDLLLLLFGQTSRSLVLVTARAQLRPSRALHGQR